jgi:hypothetical protein
MLRAGRLPSSADLGAYVGIYTATMAHLQDVGFHAHISRNMAQIIRDGKTCDRGPVTRELAKYGITLPPPSFPKRIAPWVTTYRQVGIGLNNVAHTGHATIAPAQARGLRGGAKIIRVQDDGSGNCYDSDGNVISCYDDSAMGFWQDLGNNLVNFGAVVAAGGALCSALVVTAPGCVTAGTAGIIVAGIGGAVLLIAGSSN